MVCCRLFTLSEAGGGGGHSLRFLIITMNITEKTLKTLSVKHLIAFKHQGPKFEGKKLSLKYLISQFQYRWWTQRKLSNSEERSTQCVEKSNSMLWYLIQPLPKHYSRSCFFFFFFKAFWIENEFICHTVTWISLDKADMLLICWKSPS